MNDNILFDDEFISPVVLFAAAAVGGICFFLAYFSVNPFFYGVVVLIDFILLVNFYSCRVTVTEGQVLLRYGIGLFRSVFPRHSVDAILTTKNQVWTAWIYRPFSDSAIVIILRDGARIAAPAVEPKRLADLIRLSAR